MTSAALDIAAPELLALLRARTGAVHDRLDHTITALDPFADIGRYGQFLLVQHDFHAQVGPLFDRADLEDALPGLGARNRLNAVRNDLADLGILVPDASEPILENVDIAIAAGWVYVAEGSSLGAAILLKQASRIGLGETFGARHLAGHPDGRGLHWRRFTQALNALDLTENDKARASAAAQDAFTFVRASVAARMGDI